MEEALGQRLRADPTFYNAGLSAVSLRWTWTLELLARMLRADMAPDSFTMNSALSGLVRGDQWRVAVQVMEEMESMRVRADIITFNTLLNVARWHKLELLSEQWLKVTSGESYIASFLLTEQIHTGDRNG